MPSNSVSYWDRTNARFRPARPLALDPETSFYGAGENALMPSVIDFWRWGFSDLKDNTIRGIFGEFIVANALGIPVDIKKSWEPYDLLTPEGVRVEVKTSAYLQSWAQDRRSKILFSGLKGRSWDAATGMFSGEPTFNADVYVFCVQHAEEHQTYDRLDLSQWHFYVLPSAVIESINSKSISESKLLKLGLESVPYGGIRAQVQKL